MCQNACDILNIVLRSRQIPDGNHFIGEVRRISWIYAISAILVTLAFIVLVVYVVRTLRTAEQSLHEVKRTLSDVQQTLDQLSGETMELIQNTNQITSDVKQKIASVDKLFDSAKQAGEAVNQVTTSAKQVSATVARSVHENVEDALKNNKNRIADVVQWVSTGMVLWHKWKSLNANSTKKLTKGEEHDGGKQ